MLLVFILSGGFVIMLLVFILSEVSCYVISIYIFNAGNAGVQLR